MNTPTRNLEQLLADRNGALTAALVRIRALAGARHADRDFQLVFQMAEDAIAQVGASAGYTAIGVAYERWRELMMANFATDAEGIAAAQERRSLEQYIIAKRAVCASDVLSKVNMLNKHSEASIWGRQDEMMASIAADLESLAGKGGAS
jgi:hypothetical protein